MKRLILSAIATFGLLTHLGIAPAFASNARDYVVQPGDTLTGIARQHTVSASQLARTNGLHPHSWVYVGQRLIVPGDATRIARYGEDPEPVFKAGNIGMFQNGRWATPGIREVDFNWDVVKLPDGPGGPSNWQFWGAYVVNANTENPQAAWDLVTALTSAPVQAQVSALGANVPSRVSQEALDAFLTFSPPENNQAFLDGLSENPVTEAPLWNGDWPSYRDAMNTAVNSVVTGDLAIDEYQVNICTELNQYFDG